MSMAGLSRSEDVGALLRREFQAVLDPEIGRSVVDVGLIYGIDVGEDGSAVIQMTTTTRGCPATAFMMEAVRECAVDSGLIRSAEVRLVYDPPWTPDMMAD